MGNTVVLDGELSLDFAMDGELKLDLSIDGEPDNIIKVSDRAYPIYTGETVVTPTRETQVLNTSNKAVLTNITVNPIPITVWAIE